MKEYKFIFNSLPNVLTKEVNKHIKKGFVIENWKLNNNTIVVLLSKENKNESDFNQH